MDFVILDLEWNGTYSRRLKGFMNEIIEFGAVKVNEGLEILDTFSALVRPQVGKKLSGKIKSLTNLTNEELASGLQFMQVISRFTKWMGKAVLMTWGTSDILALTENCKYFCGNERIPFLKQYVNLQSYCEERLHYDANKRMGLSTSAQLLGIDEQSFAHHRALDDSLLSLRCLQALYDKEALKEFIQNAEEKVFYDKILFKTVVVCDLSNPLIKRTDLMFNCEFCGRRAHRESDWVLKNKSYRASFLCRNCRTRFYGRVQFKLKFDGMVVKKTILPYKEVEPKEPCAVVPTKEIRAVAKEASKAKERAAAPKPPAAKPAAQKQQTLAKPARLTKPVKPQERSVPKEVQNEQPVAQKRKEVKVKPRYRYPAKKKTKNIPLRPKGN